MPKLMIRLEMIDTKTGAQLWQAYSEGADRAYNFAGDTLKEQEEYIERLADCMEAGQDVALEEAPECFDPAPSPADIQEVLFEVNDQLLYGTTQATEAIIYTVGEDQDGEGLWDSLKQAGEALAECFAV
ncbi:hypothetical protein [Yoonia sp. I 8.24]|uniref:hypothetical protein n=1 Tax=Yoonia sp. I 8.24 TaxID=1537229 RepID=UPI001EDE3402|nr:hypothetical protein [Yoonia sp. I 8.24]MCG3266131.1 hypothetical protein [Yoonia sp. I 8.24]